MKPSLHLRVAALIAHVVLCTAIVLEVVQADTAEAGAAVPAYHPDHR